MIRSTNKRQKIEEFTFKITLPELFYYIHYKTNNSDVYTTVKFIRSTEVDNELFYFHQLISQDKFQLDKEYKYSELFEVINPYKDHIEIEYFDKLKDSLDITEDIISKIWNLLLCNVILNDYIYLNISEELIKSNGYHHAVIADNENNSCLLYTSPSPRDV
jgi:hypothetical protein